MKGDPKQSFDANGNCEHVSRIKQAGRTYWLWSTRDECIFCGCGEAFL